MLKIIVSEKAKEELNRLRPDFGNILDRIIEYVPKIDLIELAHIRISDLPDKQEKMGAKAAGAYYQKNNIQPAYIEICLKTLFSHMISGDSLNQMV
jgi:hypothetical protein